MTKSFAELFDEQGMEGFKRSERDARDKILEVPKGARKEMPQSPEHSLDLHGFTLMEAPDAIQRYIAKVREIGLMFVLITFGMGRHSPEGKSRLRPVVVKKLLELQNDHKIRNFCSALPKDGGYGAMYVYLK